MSCKQQVLSNECLFQRACGSWVGRYIGECVSSLMYDVGHSLEECSRIFDFDYDEAMGWFAQDDFEEPVTNFINEADLDDLETIADKVGWWDDVLKEAGVPEVEEFTRSAEDPDEEDEDAWRFTDKDGTCHIFDDEDDAIEAARMSVIDTIREKIIDLITSDDEWREIADEFDIEADRWEIYEHWTIPEGWTANDLRQHGEVVFDFGGLRIWGRATTGQAISMDGVIRSIVRELDEDHWIWAETCPKV